MPITLWLFLHRNNTNNSHLVSVSWAPKIFKLLSSWHLRRSCPTLQHCLGILLPRTVFSLMQCIIMSMWIWSRGECGEGEEETGWGEFYTTINYFYPKARHFGKIFTLTRKQGHQWSNLIRGKVCCWLTMPSCSMRAHSWGEKVQPYIFSCCVLKVLLFEEVLKKFIFLKVWCMHSFTSFNRTALT